MNEENEMIDYKELYEKERQKSASLAGRLADAKNEAEYLQFQLNRIKNNPIFKATRPLRMNAHRVINLARRVKNLGGPRGIARKLRQKKYEKQAMKLHGTASFPTPEEAKRQRETVFPKKIKISILVPLYNTPKDFLHEMIQSVTTQTYGNWELCLADGSDKDH